MSAAVNWIDKRRQDFADACRYLKSRCIAVSAIDRHAMIVRYKVAGKRELMLESDVIAYANWLKGRQPKHPAIQQIEGHCA